MVTELFVPYTEVSPTADPDCSSFFCSCGAGHMVRTLALPYCYARRILLYLQVAFTRYGEEFRRQRRLMARGLAQGRIPQYHPLITASVRPLLRALIASSGRDFVPAIRRYAGGLALSVFYGLEATRDDDLAMLKVEQATDLLANEAAGGGLWAVDIFPFRACIVPAA